MMPNDPRLARRNDSTASRRLVRVFLVVVGLSISLCLSPTAHSQLLTTTFAGGDGFNGNMFDVEAFNPLTITSFDVNVTNTVTQNLAVYYKLGTYVGAETTPSAW